MEWRVLPSSTGVSQRALFFTVVCGSWKQSCRSPLAKQKRSSAANRIGTACPTTHRITGGDSQSPEILTSLSSSSEPIRLSVKTLNWVSPHLVTKTPDHPESMYTFTIYTIRGPNVGHQLCQSHGWSGNNPHQQSASRTRSPARCFLRRRASCFFRQARCTWP